MTMTNLMVLMEFDTIPTGLEVVSLNGIVLDTPGTATTWEKQILTYMQLTINIKMAYSFNLWSHGGVQNQTFVVPNNGNAVPKLAGCNLQTGQIQCATEAIQSET